MAGAMTTDAEVARQMAVTTSSARPAAMAAIQRAVAGATMIRSALSAATMWPMRESGSSSNGSSWTERRVSVSSVNGPRNLAAEWVIAAWTSAPAATSARASSAAL